MKGEDMYNKAVMVGGSSPKLGKICPIEDVFEDVSPERFQYQIPERKWRIEAKADREIAKAMQRRDEFVGAMARGPGARAIRTKVQADWRRDATTGDRIYQEDVYVLLLANQAVR